MRWMMMVMLLVSACREDAALKPDPAGEETTKTETREAKAKAPEPEPEPTLRDKLAKADREEALMLLSPHLEDEVNSLSPGTANLAIWGMQNMKWADVSVATNETSIAKIHKDSDRERGKRMCVRGAIIQIAADKSSGVGTAYVGLMTAPTLSQIVHFIAVGDTGELVQNSPARFCGIVTGRYSYANSGGGTTHAVGMVGMFDLPANRATE